ncbi:MAG: transposase [Magnetococcales bacterium]|nr:transposase [Magnetococcales bacterium]
MARLARAVIPGEPHYITQRGNRRQRTFFQDEDYRLYLELMTEWCCRIGVEIWAYCLMPNHVHLIAVPGSSDGLRKAIGEAHRRYTQSINAREKWQGHLWQGRFASFPMDEAHLLAAARFIELNPVRSQLAPTPSDHPWSSAKAHMSKTDDILVKTPPLLTRVADWAEFLSVGTSEETAELLRKHERTGRPLGDESFLSRLESLLQRPLAPQKRGRKASGDRAVPLRARSRN